MLGFLFNDNKEKETKEFKNYIGHSISREEALKRLELTERDLKDFLIYKSCTPLQRVMADLNYKEDLISLLLMTNTYYTANQKELKFEFQTAETFESAVLDCMKKINIIPNRLMLIKAIYNLYGYYYVKTNGTKQEQLVELATNSKLPLDTEDIELTVKAYKPISTSERRKQKRNRQKKRKLEAKAKEALQSI